MPANSSRELAAMARRLETMSKTWKTEARTILRDVVKHEAVPAVQAAARARLPKSGGLNEWIAAQPISVRATLTPRSAGVRMVQPYPDARYVNSGFVRHPVFADGTKTRKEWTWVNQPIPNATGWWTQTLTALGPAMTAQLVVMVREMNAAITRSKWGAL